MTVYLASNTQLFTPSSQFKFSICPINAHDHVITLHGLIFLRDCNMKICHINKYSNNQYNIIIKQYESRAVLH